MKKKYSEFLILLIVFLIFVFQNAILSFKNKKDYSLIVDGINKELEEENKSLKEYIKFQDNLNYDFITSKVRFRDIYEFYDTIQIYKGSNEGLKKGLAVVNEDGLIGVVSKVYKEYSIVRLITNKDSKISVKINDVYGILQMQNNKLVVKDINNVKTINKNDQIFTSGLGNIPGDIYIGTVKDIKMDNLEIEQIIDVDCKIDFDHLKYVMVRK